VLFRSGPIVEFPAFGVHLIPVTEQVSSDPVLDGLRDCLAVLIFNENIDDRGVGPKFFGGTPVAEIEPRALKPKLSKLEILEFELARDDRDGGGAGFCDGGDDVEKFFEIFSSLLDGGIDRVDGDLVGVVGVSDDPINDVEVI